MRCNPSQQLITKIELRQQLEKEQAQFGWYYWLLAKHPFLVVFLCLLVTGTFAAVTFLFTDLPDFTEPSKGFEVRGNLLANKILTWQKLLNFTGYKLKLSNYPYNYFEKINEITQTPKSLDLRIQNRIRRSNFINASFTGDLEDYFCDNPRADYASWTFRLDGNKIKSLWSVDGLQLMCSVEEKIISHPSFLTVCTRNTKIECCPLMSLPNSVAFLAGLQSCHNITRHSFLTVQSLLVTCARYYCDGSLKPDCWKSARVCVGVPMQCQHYDVVYSVFHYFWEASLVCPFQPARPLRFVASFLPAFKFDNHLITLYYAQFNQPFSDDIKIYSVDFGINDLVFEDFLISDTVYPVVAMAIVGLILFLYTGSLFVTLMSFLSTLSSMLCSYFLYKVLLGFTFFPFMNLAAILVMIGICADSVLMFCSAWKDAAQHGADDFSPQLIVKATLGKVTWSLVVTSATTAAAFFASYSSHVTAIKCFAVYTGLTVLVNLFLSLSWLPAVLVIYCKFFARVFCLNKKCRSFSILQFFEKMQEITSEYFRVFFDQILVLIIVRWRFVWVSLNFLVALGGVFVVLVYPGLRLPSGKTYFHYFQPAHPFETGHMRTFSFQNHSSPHLHLRFVFGVWPRDLGDPRDPMDRGKLQLQRHFNVSNKQSQVWLLELCKLMRNSSYYSQALQQNYLPLNQTHINCFIDGFKAWMGSQTCVPNQLCCKRHRFPYEPRVFEHCLKEAVFQISRTPGIHLYKDSPGPRFDSRDNIRAVIISFQTNLTYTDSYDEIKKFYDDTESFFNPLLQSAPVGLSGGWIVSDLEFFALQKGLYEGTITSIGWSLLIGLLIILVTTRNLIVAFLTTLTISCVIFVTVGCLVLLGWQLNILESVTVSIAIGMSVDFTAHYAIAYLQATPRHDRTRRVEVAVARVCPAVLLAALTTFVAGAGMLPATVLVYTKFGVFLMLIMASSWWFGTSFFLPLLAICGPTDDCCTLRCKRNARESQDESVMATETSTCSPPTSSNYEVIERSTVL